MLHHTKVQRFRIERIKAITAAMAADGGAAQAHRADILPSVLHQPLTECTRGWCIGGRPPACREAGTGGPGETKSSVTRD